MDKKIQEVRTQLMQAAKKLRNSEATKGCCHIQINGSTATKSDITRETCRRIANNFPNATYSFYPGQKCSEV